MKNIIKRTAKLLAIVVITSSVLMMTFRTATKAETEGWGHSYNYVMNEWVYFTSTQEKQDAMSAIANMLGGSLDAIYVEVWGTDDTDAHNGMNCTENGAYYMQKGVGINYINNFVYYYYTYCYARMISNMVAGDAYGYWNPR